MGTLSRIGLEQLVREHRIDTLVETGTGHGHSILAALQVPALGSIHSIEIDHETWHRAFVTFADTPRVHLYLGDSPFVLARLAVELGARRVLWFLDAHFAGSGRLVPTPLAVRDPETDVPLRAEFAALGGRDLSGDVIVVDDLCLFEPGAEGDAAELRRDLRLGPLQWIDELLAATHSVARLPQDGGYLVASPK